MANYATLLVYFTAPSRVAFGDLVTELRPALSDRWASKQEANVVNLSGRQLLEAGNLQELGDGIAWQVKGGPYDGLMLDTPDRVIVGAKWNLRPREGVVTETILGNTRDAVRRRIRSIGPWKPIHTAIQPYGDALIGDRGIPKRPPLPSGTQQSQAKDKIGAGLLIMGAAAVASKA